MQTRPNSLAMPEACIFYGRTMRELSFVWGERKNRENHRKQGVSFEEAQSVFFDDEAREFFDPITPTTKNGSLLVGS